MSRTIQLAGLATAALLLWSAASSCDRTMAQVAQPMAFSHAKHHEEEISCTECHIRAEEGQYATTPRIATCMLCHDEPKGESGKDQQVRDFAERGEEISWVRVNRVEGHVYFSHAVHMVGGAMECADCHGDMTTIDEPVTSSQVDWLTMGACMDCHEQRGATNDCLACHK